jgi:large subunit ribosomal protein L32
MAVPKKKISKGVSRTRTKAWVRANVKRIKNMLNLVTDKETGNVRRNHHVDPVTGMYNGRQVIDKSKDIDDITTIKA